MIPSGPLPTSAADRVDASSLAIVRMVFGAVGVLSGGRLLAFGWVDTLYSDPARHFSYYGFSWVQPLPGGGMRLVVLTMLFAAVLVALGQWYRPAIAAFVLTFTWVELIDATTYLNHYWFMTIVGVLMFVSPMAATCSLDARRKPRAMRATVPRGLIWLFRAQVAVVYVFAGLAKLNSDWLLHGQPLRLWLPARSDLAIVGPWLADPRAALVFSWGGALFDCTIVGFLLWKRTRVAAWCVVVAFHVATWLLFPIGVFPWLMIGMTTVFFAPDWPRHLARTWARQRPVRSPSTSAAPIPVPVPAPPRLTTWVTVLAVAWISVQVLLPLRHALYPGDARWTGEGYRFSWNVLAAEKSGSVEFRVTDRASGRTSMTSGEELYTPLQWRTMATEPELIRQAAHAVRHAAGERGQQVEVRVDAFVSINGGVARRLIDPNVDLASEPPRLTPQPWILR